MSTLPPKPYDEYRAFSSDKYNAGFAIKLQIDGGIRSTAALVSLNAALDSPFVRVPLNVRALAFALYQDGYPIEVRYDGKWQPCTQPSFEPHLKYRVRPKPDDTPITVEPPEQERF